ncbi:uncharacterized protein CEXT_188461 [Caerostris extrusa]|uniref:Fibronectin type-III domain-containing protein n=1 Tax=Caerostris extrusa TaxID=172846 RepID=A0AAV4S0R5_CAEEX|nr:uncharacterized protein CEXT_188461 [Caerostris extrusa]
MDLLLHEDEDFGVPEEPKNCQVTNRTSDCLYLDCESGEDGGLQQIFQLEVMSTDSDKFLANLTARNAPNFIVCSLPPKESFILVVYAVNSKGRSKASSITLQHFSWSRERYSRRPETLSSANLDTSVLEKEPIAVWFRKHILLPKISGTRTTGHLAWRPEV